MKSSEAETNIFNDAGCFQFFIMCTYIIFLPLPSLFISNSCLPQLSRDVIVPDSSHRGRFKQVCFRPFFACYLHSPLLPRIHLCLVFDLFPFYGYRFFSCNKALPLLLILPSSLLWFSTDFFVLGVCSDFRSVGLY